MIDRWLEDFMGFMRKKGWFRFLNTVIAILFAGGALIIVYAMYSWVVR